MNAKKIDLDAIDIKEKAYLIGIIVGDGYLYHDNWRHYKVNIYLNPNKDKDVANFVLFLLKKVGLNPYEMHHHGCLVIRFNSKSFFNFIEKELKRIKNIDIKNKDFMIGFISGFIDSDGYVSYGDIVISNKKKELIEKTNNFCKNLKIYSKIWSQHNLFRGKIFDIWRLRIGTSFKYEEHYSQKLNRIYGGALPIIASINSEMDDTYKGGVARKSRRAHNP